MKISKRISKSFNIFAFLALVILSVSFANAQANPDTCLSISPVNVPPSIVNTQNTFQATFNVNFAGGQCVNRTINSITLNSVFSGSTASVGSWSVSNTFPITLSSTNNQILVTATYILPSSGIGNLVTNVNINTTSAATGNPTLIYNFNLPNINITSPAPTLTIQTPSTPVEFGQNTTITVTNTGTASLSNILLTEVTNFGLTFNPASISSLAAGSASSPINIILSSLTGLKFGLNNVQVKAQSGTVTSTSTFQLKKTFCSNGQAGGNLDIKDFKIDNLDGDDDTWQIFDEIEIKVEIENTGNEDIDDVFVELGLFAGGSDFIDDLDWQSSDEEQVDIGSINDGDEETETFKFIVPAEFAERGNEDYMLAVKAYSDDLGEENECVDTDTQELSDDFFESIDVEVEDEEERFVIVNDIQMPSQATCGETVSGQFTVANVGEDDQERVRITMQNSELNINQEFEITSDLELGDEKTLFFSFNVHPTAANKLYTINFRTEYDYDDGDYDVISEETFKGIIEVIGCSGSGTTPLGNTGGSSNAIITASLTSDAVPGEELVVESTITNSGTDTATYTIGVTGYSEWATLEDISDTTVTLAPGENKKVTIKLTVDEEVSESESFTIQTISEGRISSQEVEVNFEDKKGFSFDFDNNLIWIIAAINLVLIILIIVVAVRLARK